VKTYHIILFIIVSSALKVTAQEELKPHYPKIEEDKPQTAFQGTTDNNQPMVPQVVEVEGGQEIVFKKGQKKN
jgi:hypothetical protein